MNQDKEHSITPDIKERIPNYRNIMNILYSLSEEIGIHQTKSRECSIARTHIETAFLYIQQHLNKENQK